MNLSSLQQTITQSADEFSAMCARLGFGTGLSQHARLITMATAQGSDLPDALVVDSFSGHEGINRPFWFEIEALSVSTDVDLKQFIGEEITLRLLQADGSYRAWHGYCTEAVWLGADGGIARYRLRLESFLYFLTLRRDSYVFQDKTVRDILTELFADYPQAQVNYDISQTLITHPVMTQYRESDFTFLSRILAAEGLSWRFEHQQDDGADSAGSAPSTGSAHAKHSLVIFDSKAVLPDMSGDSDLRFHGVRATDSMDAINQFSALRRVQANAVSVSSWDPLQLVAPNAEQSSAVDNGDLPMLAVYQGSGESKVLTNAAASQQADQMLQAMEMNNKTFSGSGSVRSLAAGHIFSLSQHDHYPVGDNDFVVTDVQHRASNNFDANIAQDLFRTSDHDLERGTYRNQFSCVRKVVSVLPAATAQIVLPTTKGAQVAIVVGLADAALTTERNHRIKVQFPWQRGAAPVVGGLTDTGSNSSTGAIDASGNAPGDERAGTWVRVAEALAGPNWGSHFMPRIGTEVLVDFIDGDMDRPLVVAALFTGNELPPYSAGVDSGVNHAGVLSGIHSANLSGDGYNQWVSDDTQAQLRTRLASSTASSQLNLGYLIAQSPSSAQRGNYRGQGFELRSDAWSVLRGSAGVLLSTMARSGHAVGATSTQMDVAESVAQLKGAKALSEAISKAATHQQALSSTPAQEAQANAINAIDPQQQGKYQGSINGQDSKKPTAGGKTGGDAVEKFANAVIQMESPSSINWASPASSILSAGQHIHWTTQGDLQMTAGISYSAVSGKASTLFTHAGGIQAYAGNGAMSLQAHTDQLEILADKDITLIAVNDHIEINANQKISLMAGHSSIVLDGGNITFTCPGNFTVKGAQHVMDAGASQKATLGKLPDTRVKLFDEGFVLKDAEGLPIPGIPYRIKLPDGRFEEGISDALGRTHVVMGADPDKLQLHLPKKGTR